MSQVIFSIPFTGKTPWYDGFMGQEWFRARTMVFGNYTVKSLKAQTDKDFIVWLQFRPEEKDNPMISLIENSLTGLNYVLTFDSPIMYEDRAIWHNIDLKERAKRSLAKIAPLIKEDIYEINLDSDDMVCNTFVETVKKSSSKAVYTRKGYILAMNGDLAPLNHPISSQIYGIRYSKETFLDAKKHFYNQIGGEKLNIGLSSHEQIPEIFQAEMLPDGSYCSVFNGYNISTIWGNKLMGKEITSEEDKNNILTNFK